MKTLYLTIFTLLVSLTATVNTFAGPNSVNGLLIGAGSGAIAGQAIKHDSMATLVGAAVGGIMGYAIGNDLDQHGFVAHYSRHGHDSIRFGKPFDHPHGYYNHPGNYCKKSVFYRRVRGYERRIVTITCDSGALITAMGIFIISATIMDMTIDGVIIMNIGIGITGMTAGNHAPGKQKVAHTNAL